MIRQISYDLDTMTVKMKLWNLGGTAFPGYTPPGRYIGGYQDRITLSVLGRLGRISPVGTVTAYTSTSLTIDTVGGQNAQTRAGAESGLAWKPGYKISLVDGETKAVLETLTIASVSGSVITVVETIATTVLDTTYNGAGFIDGGHYIEQASYNNTTEPQKQQFAHFSGPTSSYPTTRARELEEQRGGLHSFEDGGIPYILYPDSYQEL